MTAMTVTAFLCVLSFASGLVVQARRDRALLDRKSRAIREQARTIAAQAECEQALRNEIEAKDMYRRVLARTSGERHLHAVRQ